MKVRLGLILLLCAAVWAQTTAPEPPVPPQPPAAQSPARPQQPPVPPEPTAPPSAGVGETRGNPNAEGRPEARISPQQAEELFRSVDEILQFVSKDTGLPIKHKVKRQLASRDQVESYIQSRMEDDEDAKRLQRTSVVLKKFGLLPRDFDLKKFLIALLKEQVAGYYDAKTQTVYLLDWVEPEQQKPVLAHELTHALQDQNFGLEQLSKNAKKNDPTGLQADERLAAREAVIEGQGMIVLMDYMLAPMGSSVARQPELVDAMQAGLMAASPGMAVFNHAPMFVQQVLVFPYRYGTLFERDVLIAEGKQKAFAGVLKNPPADTRQIMQPDTYLQGQVAPPLTPLDFNKLAPGYKKWDLSNMGEFDVLLLLDQYATPEIAKDLSSRWRGGYYWAARLPNDSHADDAMTPDQLAVIYISRWSNPETAARFAGAYAKAIPKRYPEADQVSGVIPPRLKEVPGAGVQVTISPQLSGPASWQTRQGQVTVEPRGDTVLVMEGLDAQTAKHVRDAVFP